MGLGVAGSVALAGAAVSAGSGLIGSAMQSGAVSGANSSAQAALGQQLNNLAPYRQAGLPAVQAQQDLLGLNGQDAANAAMANYQTSPGYQWQMQQGLRATDAGAAASGMLRSGAALKAEQTFGQGLANSDFGTYYNRLAGLSTLGANAAAGSAQTAGQQAQADIGAGTAQSSIYGNTASGIAGDVNNLLSNKAFQSWMSGSAPQQMTGFAPAMVPGQQGVGGFVAPPASSYG